MFHYCLYISHCTFIIIVAEFIMLKKDKFEDADLTDVGVYHDANITMENAPFLTKILDSLDKLNWGPYQVTQ